MGAGGGRKSTDEAVGRKRGSGRAGKKKKEALFLAREKKKKKNPGLHEKREEGYATGGVPGMQAHGGERQGKKDLLKTRKGKGENATQLPL